MIMFLLSSGFCAIRDEEDDYEEQEETKWTDDVEIKKLLWRLELNVDL